MIVLDTHVLIWRALAPKRLSKKAKQTLDEAEQKDRSILISNISLWEIAMLMKRGRFKIDSDYLPFIDLIRSAYPYQFIPLSPDIADLSVHLADEINRDPADRIICATAVYHQAKLITADKNLRKAKSLATVW